MELLRNIFLAIGLWIYPIVGIELLLESSAFFGLVLPGDTVVILMGVLAGTDVLSLWGSALLVVASVFGGDLAGYALGRWKGEHILEWSKWAKRRYDRRRDQLAGYQKRWGVGIIVIGRFLPFLRAVTPFSMGLGGMTWPRFLPAAVLASFSWAGGFFALGYEFGSHWRQVESIMEPVGGGVAGAMALGVAGWFCWRRRGAIKTGFGRIGSWLRARTAGAKSG